MCSVQPFVGLVFKRVCQPSYYIEYRKWRQCDTLCVCFVHLWLGSVQNPVWGPAEEKRWKKFNVSVIIVKHFVRGCSESWPSSGGILIRRTSSSVNSEGIVWFISGSNRNSIHTGAVGMSNLPCLRSLTGSHLQHLVVWPWTPSYQVVSSNSWSTLEKNILAQDYPVLELS